MHFRRLLLLVSILSMNLLITSAGWCDESYESDRGYREPAVIGPAIIEDQEVVITQDHAEGAAPSESEAPVASDIFDQDDYK